MQKRKYKCTACAWKFTRAFEPKLCPQCGKAEVVLDTSSGAAEELLKEIEEFEAGLAKKEESSEGEA